MSRQRWTALGTVKVRICRVKADMLQSIAKATAVAVMDVLSTAYHPNNFFGVHAQSVISPLVVFQSLCIFGLWVLISEQNCYLCLRDTSCLIRSQAP